MSHKKTYVLIAASDRESICLNLDSLYELCSWQSQKNNTQKNPAKENFQKKKFLQGVHHPKKKNSWKQTEPKYDFKTQRQVVLMYIARRSIFHTFHIYKCFYSERNPPILTVTIQQIYILSQGAEESNSTEITVKITVSMQSAVLLVSLVKASYSYDRGRNYT